jgi:RimJ/RimL family protein N-acetyltransferase
LSATYIFTSARLGFRNWSLNDLPEFAEMNADSEVMQYFPKKLTTAESAEFIERLQKHFDTHGYNYFAVELLESGELIGFIGLAYQEYEADFTPATDIGWRLKHSAWGKGYATEGALRCLKFAFTELKLPKVVSICVVQNLPSEAVMKKIGMTKKGHFTHPKLFGYPGFEDCVWYQITKEEYQLEQPL